jgi:hypothetical protein
MFISLFWGELFFVYQFQSDIIDLFCIAGIHKTNSVTPCRSDATLCRSDVEYIRDRQYIGMDADL